jgi:hypothetical protein
VVRLRDAVNHPNCFFISHQLAAQLEVTGAIGHLPPIVPSVQWRACRLCFRSTLQCIESTPAVLMRSDGTLRSCSCLHNQRRENGVNVAARPRRAPCPRAVETEPACLRVYPRTLLSVQDKWMFSSHAFISPKQVEELSPAQGLCGSAGVFCGAGQHWKREREPDASPHATPSVAEGLGTAGKHWTLGCLDLLRTEPCPPAPTWRIDSIDRSDLSLQIQVSGGLARQRQYGGVKLVGMGRCVHRASLMTYQCALHRCVSLILLRDLMDFLEMSREHTDDRNLFQIGKLQVPQIEQN